MIERERQEIVYGKYTIKAIISEGENKKKLISGFIHITSDDGTLQEIGHFVYACELALILKDRDDFETFPECAEIVTQYLKETMETDTAVKRT